MRSLVFGCICCSLIYCGAEAQTPASPNRQTDSLDAIQNRIVWIKLLTSGHVHVKRSANRFWQVGALLPNLVQFNTVEGWSLSQSINFNQGLPRRQFLSTGASIRYGFSAERLYAKGQAAYTFDQNRNFTVMLAGGRFTQQFNDQSPIGLGNNTFTSLLRGQNFLKIFERQFAEVRLQRDLGQGFTPSLRVGYEARLPLQNTNLYSLRRQSRRRYTSNNPQAPSDAAPAFEPHRALWYELQLKLHPDRLTGHESLPDVGTRWPVIWLSYQRGVPTTWQSQIDYERLSLRLAQRFLTGHTQEGEFRYELAIGGFRRANRLYFIDFNHFAGNQSGFSSNRIDAFAMLPYYGYSNASWYLRVHVEQRTGGRYLAKIPVLKRWGWQEILAGRLLYTPERKLYAEANVGIENILRVYRLDLVLNYTDRLGVAWRLGVAL